MNHLFQQILMIQMIHYFLMILKNLKFQMSHLYQLNLSYH